MKNLSVIQAIQKWGGEAAIVFAAGSIFLDDLISHLIPPALHSVARNGKDFVVVLFFYLLYKSQKRTTKMVATGLGEIKSESPNLDKTSADPAIQREINKSQITKSGSIAFNL